MVSESKHDTPSRAWHKAKRILFLLVDKLDLLSWLNPERHPALFLAAAAASVSVPVGVQNAWQRDTIMEINRLNLTPIYFQLDELKRQQDELLEIVLWIKNMKNFPIDPIVFPKARTKQRAELQNGNYESVLDSSPGAGIGLLASQRKQLDRLASSVILLDEPGTIELKVEGFASTLPFLNSPCKSKSEKCNKVAANLRAKQVRDYLKIKLSGPRFHIEARSWKNYNEMDENRYYPYEQSTSSKSLPDLHVLNQAVYITISSL